jgi:hypothetical protein
MARAYLRVMDERGGEEAWCSRGVINHGVGKQGGWYVMLHAY